MTARKINGAWYADFRWKGDRVRKKSPINTKKAAEDYERELRKAFAIPEPEAAVEVPTLEVFVPIFWNQYVILENKPSEQRKKDSVYRNYLLPAFGQKRLDAIREPEVEAFRPTIRAKLAPKSCNNILAVLGKTLRYARDIGIIERVPRIRFFRSADPVWRFLDFEDAERLLAKTENPLWRTYFLVAMRTGLRFSEMCELRWTDLDLMKRIARIDRACVEGHVGTPKNGRSRVVQLTGQVVEALRAFRHIRSELVFCTDDGSRLTLKMVGHHLKMGCRRAGILPVRPHDLRHTCASHLAMLGRSPQGVKEHLGHLTLSQTARYMHLSPSSLRSGIDLLDAGQPKFGHYLGIGKEGNGQALEIKEENR